MGSRVRIIDPNNFDNQYAGAGGILGSSTYNMSVPQEDLSILVELSTTSKRRTVLIVDGSTTQTINTGVEDGDIKFISGSKNLTTGGQRFLTTSYTDISTTLTPIEEALGITDINIEFNSSYAPMITINFVDVRGGAIFQSGANSIYNVLFRLPYPLFKLKVKGFYGKPVTYCLHMVKCNTRFNSQNGNFEITAEFVGYTYALLSDMIVGYIRAAGMTTDGALLLKDKNTIQINEFIKIANNIDKFISDALSDIGNETRNNLARVNQLIIKVDGLLQLTNENIQKLKANSNDPTITPACKLAAESNNQYIVIVADPEPSDTENFKDEQNKTDTTDFITKYNTEVSTFNVDVGDLTEAKIDVNKKLIALLSISKDILDSNAGINNETAVADVKKYYNGVINTENTTELTKLFDKLRSASSNVTPSDNYLKWYDYSILVEELNRVKKALELANTQFQEKLTKQLAENIRGQLGFAPNIRNIVQMFTAHIEVFLQLLFQVSAKYEDGERKKQLSKFKNNVTQKLDIKNDDDTIYPWPEFIKDGKEEYLGKRGILDDPLKVPEIKFVEELYTEMVRAQKQDENPENLSNQPAAWASIVPADSIFYIEKTPYDRLPDNTTHDDLAVYAMLRAAAFLGFNQYLTKEEIEAFATKEGDLIVAKFGESNILKALTTNYKDFTAYKDVKMQTSTSNFKTELFGKSSGLYYLKGGFYSEYQTWSDPQETVYRTVVPFDKGFNKVDYSLLSNKYSKEKQLSSFRVTTRNSNLDFKENSTQTGLPSEEVCNCYTWDDAKYIEILTDSQLKDKINATSRPATYNPQALKFAGLNAPITKIEESTAAGFIVSSGALGVQDFATVNYVGSNKYAIEGDLSYFSIFYDNIATNLPIQTTGLARGRKDDTKVTSIDLPSENEKNKFIPVYPFHGMGLAKFEDYYVSFLDKFLGDWGPNLQLASVNDGSTITKNIDNFTAQNSPSDVSYPYFNFLIDLSAYDEPSTFSQNLFASRFYNAQSKKARAFLFLHCFPWRGLADCSFLTEDDKEIFSDGIFDSENYPVINSFINRPGFIQVPELWPAFIGSLLWRRDDNIATGGNTEDPIIWTGGTYVAGVGGSGGTRRVPESLLPTGYAKVNYVSYDHFYPSRSEYLRKKAPESRNTSEDLYLKEFDPVAPMSFYSPFSKIYDDEPEYVGLDRKLLNLPTPIKDKFRKAFEDFYTNDWDAIAKNLELSPDGINPFTDDTWKQSWNAIVQNTSTTTNTDNDRIQLLDTQTEYSYTTLSTIETHIKTLNGTKLTDRYKIFVPFKNDFPSDPKNTAVKIDPIPQYSYNFFVENKKGGDTDKTLVTQFFKFKWLENNSIYSFTDDYNEFSKLYSNLSFDEKSLESYVTALNAPLSAKIEEQNKLFFSNNENYEIKLAIYRTLKKIYDKWVGGVGGSGPTSYNDILFQCCTVNPSGDQSKPLPERISTDKELAKKRNSLGVVNLIDSFRFVSRSFKDIGDDFQIHPGQVTNLMYQSADVGFYDLLSRLLTENNFDFVPLPNYIDFSNENELKEVFTPFPYYKAAKVPPTGPSFVCVYVGQTSTKLDFKKSDYPNDGFDLRGNCVGCPPDFTEEKRAWEDYITSFIVRYGHQNQNIFKDIRLDQAEFNETAESLQITDAISNSLNSSSGTYVGQNLYNVYSVRSYKVEVEMMGNAMIQPMMYFQLDNIPMFHGAYLITKVKHALTPNNMSTSFTGTRIRYAQTPIIDVVTLYSSLLQGGVLAGATGAITSGGIYLNYVNKYQQILKENAPKDTNNAPVTLIEGTPADATRLATAAENELKNWNNGSLNENDADGKVYIGRYWKRTEQFTYDLGPHGIPSEPWSSAFISYIMKSSDEKFPQAPAHYGYVTDAMDGVGGYEVFALKSGLKIKAQIGDILTNPRPGDYIFSHSDVIYKIENNQAFLVGGNRGSEGTVKSSTINLEDGYITDSTDVGTYLLITKKTNNKYYGGKKLSTLSPSLGGGGGVGLNNANLWIYLTWQQGTDGAIQHYKVANGTQSAYKDNVPSENITSNWPSGFVSDDGVSASDVPSLYTTNPQKLANAYINVYVKFYAQKAQEALALINGNGKNRTQTPYLSFKNVFETYQNSAEYLSWENLATIGFIENALCTDTNPNKTYQTMFQMDKGNQKFKVIIDAAKKGDSGYSSDGVNFVDYDINIVTKGVVPLMAANFREFKKETGFAPVAVVAPSTPPLINASTDTSLIPNDIIIGDSLSECLGKNLKKINSKVRLISESQGESSLWQVGKNAEWLINALKVYPVSNNVANVVVSIGTNDGFSNSNNLVKLVTELRRVFPNAKYFFVRGSYGWEGNAKLKPSVWPGGNSITDNADVITYYSAIVAQTNVKILNNGFGYRATQKEAHTCTYYGTIADEILQLIG